MVWTQNCICISLFFKICSSQNTRGVYLQAGSYRHLDQHVLEMQNQNSPVKRISLRYAALRTQIQRKVLPFALCKLSKLIPSLQTALKCYHWDMKCLNFKGLTIMKMQMKHHRSGKVCKEPAQQSINSSICFHQDPTDFHYFTFFYTAKFLASHFLGFSFFYLQT